MKKPLVVFASSASLVLLVVSCSKSPAAGGKCDGAQANVCTDANAALLCVAGVFVATKCNPGCRAAPFYCGYGDGADGAPCFEAATTPPELCSPDLAARVTCKGGKVLREICEDGKCSGRGTHAACPHVAKAGNACDGDGDWCSADGSEWLQCQNGKFVTASKCRGPGHCGHVGDGIVACDGTVGEEGDPCVGTAAACSVDAKKILACESGKLAAREACTAGKTCRGGQAPVCAK